MVTGEVMSVVVQRGWRGTYLYGLDTARHADLHGSIHIFCGESPGGVTGSESSGGGSIVWGDAGRNDKPQAVNLGIVLELHDVLDLALDGKVEKTSGVCCSLQRLNQNLVQVCSEIGERHREEVWRRKILRRRTGIEVRHSRRTSNKFTCSGKSTVPLTSPPPRSSLSTDFRLRHLVLHLPARHILHF